MYCDLEGFSMCLLGKWYSQASTASKIQGHIEI